MVLIPITTAVILAAGSGRRLRPYTTQIPKCLVEIDGRSLLSRITESVQESGFDRLIIVTGYESNQVIDHMRQLDTGLDVLFVHNELFETTNNMYSLWLIRPFVQEGFVLVESDLIFDSEALLSFRTPNRIALDLYSPDIHNGTTASVDSDGRVRRLFVSEPPPNDYTPLFKTVNITSFCDLSWEKLFHHLDQKVKIGQTGEYYELGIKALIESGESSFDIVDFDDIWWDEIDSISDLKRVEDTLGITEARLIVT